MWNNFLYSINVILPVIILVGLGYILRRTNFLSDKYSDIADKIVFKLMLPSLMFLETASNGFSNNTNQWPLIIVACVGITAAFILCSLIVPCFVKDNPKRGAIVQGGFRSNFSILGIPLADAMFGKVGTAAMAVLLPFVILLYNVYAVITLSIFAPADKDKSFIKILTGIVKRTITNPLIIAVVLGLPFMLFKIELPHFTVKSLSYLADTAIALALLSLGASMNGMKLNGRIRYSLAASLIKTLILPAVMVTVAYFVGLRGVELGLIFVLFGSPSAVSGYIMAKNMNSDGELYGQILLLSVIICPFTIFAGTFILKTIGWL